ncbi:hypothetical protein LVJ82_17965 [Vitreoscilla massiliensis]|uniref:Uncharacterized protein n=1 Tax=Vitreoscilla massiliensis TaxID=1689272 RepID=A0ABY4E0I6_9NEIS|nr:hypothetical protein [Vitreoscilla massiliensis]UOO89302.1 hypothetical protein LVJ82_17965 [Vitreoscilla massiliensis]
MNLSELWSDSESVVISEKNIAAILDGIEQNEKFPNTNKTSVELLNEGLIEFGTNLYSCPKCDRIYIDSGDGTFISYARENI